MGKYPTEMWIRWSDGTITHDKYSAPKPRKSWDEIATSVFNITYKGATYTMTIINTLIKELSKLWNRLWSKINVK